MTRAISLSLLLLFLAVLGVSGAGCSYTIHFKPAEVINSGIDSTNGHPLEVDILCLTSEDLRNYPELHALSSAEWFKDKHSKYRGIWDRVYSLTDEKLARGQGIWKGKALRGSKHEPTPPAVEVKHTQPFNRKAAFLIFARFLVKDANDDVVVDDRRPLELAPPYKYRPRFGIEVIADDIFYVKYVKN